MNISLKNKNAFACGSTQGIGKAAAIELATLGAKVTLLARNETSLKEVLNELPTPEGQEHDYICADFNEPETLREKVKDYVAKHRPVHILVNNSGGPKGGPIIEAEPDEFITAMKRLLLSGHLLVQLLLDGMKAEKYGRIINIVSTSVRQPIDSLGVSNTTRAAVAGWAKTLSNELGPYGITVNNVLPGSTSTQRIYDLIGARAKRSGRSEEEEHEELLKEIPLGCFATPEEIAASIAFLASPAASYITGVSLPVDGGKISGI